MSGNQGNGSGLRGTWRREPAHEGGRSVIFWFMAPFQKGQYELSIQASPAGTSTESYPLFPFYAAIVTERDGKQYLSAADDEQKRYLSQMNGLSDIPFRLDGEQLVIEGGSMKYRFGEGTAQVDLAGIYKRTSAD